MHRAGCAPPLFVIVGTEQVAVEDRQTGVHGLLGRLAELTIPAGPSSRQLKYRLPVSRSRGLTRRHIQIEDLFAIRQSALAADLMAAAGPVVPTLNWYRKLDLDRQLAWLVRVGVPAIAVDCSTLQGAQRWREVKSALAYVRTVMPGVELHVYGASSAKRVEDLAAFDRVVLYTARPAALARTRQVLDEDLQPGSGPEDPGLCLLTSLSHLVSRLGA